MARRSALTSDDLAVIEHSLEESIRLVQTGPTVDSNDPVNLEGLAPLFRVREKILAMSKPAAKPARSRAAAKSNTAD